MRRCARGGASLLLLAALTLGLHALGRPVTSLRLLTQPGPGPAGAAADQLLVRWCLDAGWVLLGWWWLVLASSAAARLPGRLGRIPAALQVLLTPRAVRALAAGLIGAASCTGATGAGPSGMALAAVSTAHPPPVSLGWPGAPASRAVPPLRLGRHIVVEAGDTLWGLSARYLAPGGSLAQVAASWPVLWHDNRRVVGPDPGLIHPGEVLVLPASRQPER